MTILSKQQTVRNQLVSWFGIILSIILLAWVLRECNLKELQSTISNVSYIYIISAILLRILDFLIRALRWGTLFESSIAPKQTNLFIAMMIGYLTNTILPARGGDLIRVWVLGNKENLPKSTVLATILIEKVADMLILFLLLGFTLFFFPLPAWLEGIGFVAGGCCVVAILLILLRKINGLRLLVKVLRLLKFLPKGILEKIKNLGRAFIIGLSGVFYGRNSIAFITYTSISWFSEVIIAICLAKSFHLPLTSMEVLFVILVMGLSAMVPSSPGNIGTFEFFGISTLAMLGVRGAGSQAFVFTYHSLTLLGSGLIGALCLALYYYSKKGRTNNS